jgi:hypothetical protein
VPTINFISISPHFPPNYYHFCVQLRSLGVNVLGLADVGFDSMRGELKSALTEYYKVSNTNNYDEMLRAVGYFTYRYGKIDRLESHNEYWLEMDAKLRTDFNVPGFHTSDLARIKHKSKMKKMFHLAGVATARGKVLHSINDVHAFITEVGYPIVAKPDSGVGAYKTFKINNPTELQTIFRDLPPVKYIFEEFIPGTIQTYDGLVDQNGQIVFSSSLQYNEGMMDLVNQNHDFWYYTQRVIPSDLEEIGKKVAAVYQLKERFFHFEFFRTADNKLVGLEVNMRPPGGLTTDMFDYANDINIYREYANIVVHNRFEAQVIRPYFCAYIGRRNTHKYLRSHDQIMTEFAGKIIHYEHIPGIFSAALGDYGYLARSPKYEEIKQIAEWVLEKSPA